MRCPLAATASTLVMLKGVFGRLTAYLALAMGAVGILFIGSYFVESLAVIRYATGILAIPFYLLAGVRLYRLGGHDHDQIRMIGEARARVGGGSVAR